MPHKQQCPNAPLAATGPQLTARELRRREQRRRAKLTMQVMPPPWRAPPPTPELAERAVATAAYLLPALDGFEYGGALYRAIPVLGDAAELFAPISTTFQMVPFSSLLAFLALSFVASSSSPVRPSRFVRFNIQQALFLDMLLLLPFLFPEAQNWILHVAGPDPLTFCRNFMFYLAASVIGYAAVSNVRGELPDKVPVLSVAANEFVNRA